MARRALDTASAFDEPGATPPEAFTLGAGARCYALASISLYRPQLFWGGLLATIAIPFLLVVKVLHHG
ncbi:hypothetical protein WQE_22818 [Paraburkholderia hospita]|uniref:Uncharacterized protein n=2 Tax=Paraburkholderia hospita TaxID=169430 RepID=A0ABN0FIX1_9BURK|nr:hypothetical protein WQE_22818 [Paraburkholderia hospita]OUL87867.1 hypothetical protein CA602_13005 [Paraburkholderia hospita]